MDSIIKIYYILLFSACYFCVADTEVTTCQVSATALNTPFYNDIVNRNKKVNELNKDKASSAFSSNY